MQLPYIYFFLLCILCSLYWKIYLSSKTSYVTYLAFPTVIPPLISFTFLFLHMFTIHFYQIMVCPIFRNSHLLCILHWFSWCFIGNRQINNTFRFMLNYLQYAKLNFLFKKTIFLINTHQSTFLFILGFPIIFIYSLISVWHIWLCHLTELFFLQNIFLKPFFPKPVIHPFIITIH